MSVRKPPPLIRGRTHERCPVCGEISYSLNGVHPQCSVRQADAKRMEQIKQTKETAQATPGVEAIKPWQKRCPGCRSVQHVRKKVCDCGHTFSDQPRPPSRGSDRS